jgi:ribosomal protein S12 methylthiotransferase
LDKLPQIVQSLQNSKLLDLPAGGLNNSRFRLLSSPLPFTYLKIAEGCNHKCTFCIIGDLRGRYKSRTIKSLIEEAKSLADCGIKELIIIAQDTTSFGIDIYNAFVLDKLLKGLCKISGLKWIRLLYAYPQSINNRLLNVISNNEKVCNYIDIPIQHISRRILSLMQRPPNTRKIIENISEKFPNIVLRTSLIAGFPTETDKDILELVDFLKQGHFRYAGVFDYSNNALAPSSKLGNQISPQKIKERKIILENAQYEVFKSQIELLKNKEVEVLIESVKKVPEGFDVFARAAFQAPEIDGRLTWKSSQAHQIGSFQKVKIDSLKGYTIKCREA